MLNFKNKGLVFNPSQFSWDRDFIGYAQGPQALNFDDFVRVYFALRTDDGGGKFISHIRYADFSPDLTEVLSVALHDVVSKSELGTFDEHGIFPLNVVRVGDLIYGYSNGWSRRKSVSVETGIGLLISKNDGETFERFGEGPILSATLSQPFLVGDPFVLRSLDGFRMWHLYGKSWKEFQVGEEAERVYKISDAVSADGVNWQKRDGPLISDVLGPDEAQAMPSVADFAGRYNMVFSFRQAFDFRENSKNAYRIGYAKSSDLDTWKRADSEIRVTESNSGWDSQMKCYPHFYIREGKVRLMYNGNGFGRAGFGCATLDDDDSEDFVAQ